jgi:hypothetical protein
MYEPIWAMVQGPPPYMPRCNSIVWYSLYYFGCSSQIFYISFDMHNDMIDIRHIKQLEITYKS